MFDYYSRNVYEARYKNIHGEGLKMLSHKKILEKLPIAFAKEKARNTFDKLLDEIRQNIYSLCRTKEITKKVYKCIII